jgi:cystathionine gamma-synthase
VRVSGLGRFALGQPVPDREHAVCVSLPTFRDLIGYEEKDPGIRASMRSGYPRFVQHHQIGKLIRHLDSPEQNGEWQRFLFSDEKSCREAIGQYAISSSKITDHGSFASLQVIGQSEDADSIGAFLQHSGCGISSRQAENHLFEIGELDKRETLAQNEDPGRLIKEVIAKAHGPEVSESDVLLGSSGANAFYSLFQTACEVSRPKGKNLWIRLGWLYLDTIEAMNLLTGDDEQVIALDHLDDFGKLDGIFEEYGERIAGVVTEFPTNPLLHACNLERVKDLCLKANALLVVDPTMASPKNAKVSGLADVVVNSLTKYAGSEGDVMMGSLAFPRSSPLGRELFDKTSELICPPFLRDLLRMAEQIPSYENFIEQTNQSLIKVVDFLQTHPKIGKVYWAYQSANQKAFEKQAGPDRPGCVASFETKGSFESFYDRLEMLKSPSFGTHFSICCPYVYLAHYKLLKTEVGRKKLAQAKLSPNLLRLSVGTEDPDLIIETLKDALRAT